jgi:endonuclease YncB( thermonuclease family)
MKLQLTIGLLFFATIGIHPATAEEYSGGVVKVIDGDDLLVRVGDNNIDFRLCGIDAPEKRRPGGKEATTALKEVALKKTLRCVQVGSGTPCDGRSKPTNRGRIVAQCFLGTTDIAAWMVCHGHARDWPKFSNGYYAQASRCN